MAGATSLISALSRRPRAPLGRLLWFLAISLVLIGIGCSRKEESADGPAEMPDHAYNILLITLDTTRADALGCYGAANANTPTLDRLAEEGVRLTQCRTCVSLTLPSHASILTGLYPFTHGIRNNGTRRLADSFDTLPEILKKAGYMTAAEVASAVLDARFGLDQGFDTYHDVPRGDGGRVYPQRRGDEVCDAAIEQLRALADDRFFLWVHFYDPHDPYDPPGYVGPPGRAAYAAEVAFMDAQLGRLIDELARLGLERQTLVALVSDHGEGLTDHGEEGHGYFVYETTVHVPFILWCPGTVPAGRTIEGITRTVDAFPTLLELVGLAEPEHTHGRSLVPRIRGQGTEPGGTAYAESLAGHLRFGLAPLRCVYADQFKYVWAPVPGLYDLLTDPGERRNLIDGQPALADGLHNQLKRLIDEAPPPPHTADSALRLSDADRRVLAGMGYAHAAGGDGILAESSLFEPTGPDPRVHVETINLDNLAMSAYGEGDFATAEPLLRRVVAAFPNAPMVRVDLANVLVQTNRPGKACDQLARALEAAPSDDELRLMYAEHLIQAKRWDEADTQLRLLAQKERADPLALRDLGLVRVEQGRLTEADALFERAVALDPRDPRPVRGRALVLFRQNKYAEAEALLRPILEKGAEDALLYSDLGFALEKQGRSDEAMAAYRRAILVDPDTREARESLARVLGGSGRWGQALEQHDVLVRQSPRDASRLAERAQVLARLDRHEEAVADLEAACRLRPDDVLLLRGLALVLIDAGQPEKAQARLRDAIAEGADEAIVIGLLAYATQQSGDLVEADRLYGQALAKDPRNAWIRTLHAGMLLRQERTDEAAAEFARAIEINPNEVDARLGLGQIAAWRGDVNGARTHFEFILGREPGDLRALHALGVLYARQQDWAEAARCFEKVLAVNPDHERARQDLDRVRRLMQDSASP